MIKLVCRKIYNTDYFYFSDGKNKDVFLFAIHTDDMGIFLGEDAYNDILNAVREDGKAELTIVVSVHSL